MEPEFGDDVDFGKVDKTKPKAAGLFFTTNTSVHALCTLSFPYKSRKLLVSSALAFVDMQANLIYGKFVNNANNK